MGRVSFFRFFVDIKTLKSELDNNDKYYPSLVSLFGVRKLQLKLKIVFGIWWVL